jgi:dihydrofolate reductase
LIISLIAAASANNLIGNKNKLPWHLPNDLHYFKNITWGMPVIMGRKTFEAVNKPLPGRTNIVITGQPDWKRENVITASSLSDAIEKAKSTHCKELFIAGGGEIYLQSMELADRIYLTRVHTELEGDTFFPVIDASKWKLDSSEDFEADEKNLYKHSFQKWVKI